MTDSNFLIAGSNLLVTGSNLLMTGSNLLDFLGFGEEGDNGHIYS